MADKDREVLDEHKHNKKAGSKINSHGSDEEIGFDWSNVAGLFKGIKRKTTGSQAGGVDAKKYLPAMIVIILLLIPITLSVYIRIQPNYMPITDKWSEDSIKSMLKSNIATQVNKQYPNLPDASKEEIISEQIDKIFESGVINLDGKEVRIDDIIKDQSKYFKGAFSSDETGYPYLSDLDTYYYYRLTRNYIDHGFEQDIMNEEGRYCDTKILAGMPMEIRPCDNSPVSNLHVYVSAWTYRIMHFFNSKVDLMRSFFFVTMIIATLAVIPAFFIGKKIAGNFGGLFTGLIVAVHPVFMGRTLAGFNDTDAYNVFFPLLILWLFIEAIYAKDNIRSSVFAVLSGLAVGLFGFAWNGWYFIFIAIVVAMVGYIGYLIAADWRRILKMDMHVFKTKMLKRSVMALLLMVISSAFFISVFLSYEVITELPGAIKSATELKSVGITKIWPNVYTTVAELNPANLSSTISQVSLNNKLLLFIGLMGLVLPIAYLNRKGTKRYVFMVASAVWYLVLVAKYNSFNSMHLVYAILLSIPVVAWLIYNIFAEKTADDEMEIYVSLSLILTVWFVITIYASSKGMRFIMLFVPAFAIAAGATVGIIQNHFSGWVSKELSINNLLASAVIGCLLLLLLFYPVNAIKQSYIIATNEVPMMNDGWYNTLQKIDKETAPDSIINSWWDFGHWFIAIGNRAATLDGGRQNNPAAHWLGRLMLTSDEDESIGILRYLDCGNSHGFEVLNAYNKDELKSVTELKEIIPIADKEEAKETLMSHGIPEQTAGEVLKYTHCSPPEDYFITSEDMVGKSGVWAHFGAWDFEKATMFNKVHDDDEEEGMKILMDEFGLGEEEAQEVYEEIQSQDPDQWIAPWPGYAGESAGTLSANGTVQCGNGIFFDYNTKDAYVKTTQGVMKPASVAFINTDGEFEVARYSQNILKAQNGRSIGNAIVPVSEGKFTCVLMDDELTASIFTRLFYFENIDGGLTHFRKFHQVTDIRGQKIIVWKIDWEGKSEEPPAEQLSIPSGAAPESDGNGTSN